MNITDTMNLWYTAKDVPLHEVMDYTKNEIDIKYAEGLYRQGTVSAAQTADAILRMVEQRIKTRDMVNRVTGKGSVDI